MALKKPDDTEKNLKNYGRGRFFMKFSRPIILIIFLFGFVTLAACSANQAATPTPGALPSNTKTPKPISTPHPSPTSPPTSTPVAWAVTAIEIQDWPFKAYYTVWDSNSALSVSVVDPDNKIYSIDALSGKTVAIVTPDYSTSFMSRSAKSENYEIECSDQGQEIYHLPDRQRVSEAALKVSDCNSVAWEKNESAASLVSEEGDIYVWRTDGTAPYFVGHTNMASSVAAWSPDSRRMVVPAFIVEDSILDGDYATFYIAYPDGKPVRTTRATIEMGHWEPYHVSWLTNDIVQNWTGCGFSCLSYSYFDANTGKYLIGTSGSFLMEGVFVTRVSPNERWLALETALSAEDWERRYYHEDPAMVMYDLKNHKSHVWATNDYSFALSGWANDSREFYFVRYPLEGQEPGTHPPRPAGT